MDIYFFLQYFPLSIKPFPYLIMNDLSASFAAYIFIADEENQYGYVTLFYLIHTTFVISSFNVLLIPTQGGNTG